MFAEAKGVEATKSNEPFESHDEEIVDEKVEELPIIENVKKEKKKLSRYFSLNKKPAQPEEEVKLQRTVIFEIKSFRLFFLLK